jgi:hypothetical protein
MWIANGVDLVITLRRYIEYTLLTHSMIHGHVFGNKGMKLGIQRTGEFLE